MKYLIILIMFAGCSSTPKKTPFQNNFWLGCITAYLHFQQNIEVETKIKKANDWCENAQAEVLKNSEEN